MIKEITKNGWMVKIKMKIYHSRKSDDWTTPIELYEELDKEFGFTFDPCPLHADFDGLTIDWGKINFVNPPFSKRAKFIQKGFEEWKKGKTIVFLIKSATDTKEFHHILLPFAELRFIEGRLKFGGSKYPAPFPSLIAILKGNQE